MIPASAVCNHFATTSAELMSRPAFLSTFGSSVRSFGGIEEGAPKG